MLIALSLVAVVIAAILIFASTRAATFRFERATVIAAPPSAIEPLITDFRAWPQWSPWEELDPALVRTYSGAPAGVGAVYEWLSKGKAGQGRMEILSATEQQVDIQLDFLKPFKAHNHAEFKLTPQAAGTELRWAMFGPRPFMSKLMGLFIDFDKMVGKDFEAGLADIKRVAESTRP